MNGKMMIKPLRNLALSLIALAVLVVPSFGASFDLVAEEAVATMPDTTTIPMWGFFPDTGQACNPGTPPAWEVGEQLTVPAGDTSLTINLRNCLDSHPVSIVIPGQPAVLSPVSFTDGQGRQRVSSMTNITAAGATVSYTWNNLQPGTYLYHSGTHPAVQVQMGLYGALKVEAGVGEAYTGVPYDSEVTLLYSEIDPVLHAAVADGSYGTAPGPTSTLNYKPAYFLVNGQPGPATLPAGSNNQTILLRMLNAGLMTHVPTLQGPYLSVVAENGNPYPYAKEQYSVLLAALQTGDALFNPGAAGAYSLYDRRLHLTDAGMPGGGMLTYLSVADVAGLPVANAGPDQTGVQVGVAVPLDGSGSSSPVTYLWTISAPAGSSAALTDPTIVNPTFTPDVAGVYTVQLVVNDGASDSVPDTVTVTTNFPPVANAGVDQMVTPGSMVTLDGSGSSDPDTTPNPTLTYSWLLSAPAGSGATLSDPTIVNPTFTADVAGDYVVELTVNDGWVDSAPDSVTITAAVPTNQIPVAVDDTATTTLTAPVTINVAANDTDADGTIVPSTVCTNAADCTVTTTTTNNRGTVVNNLDGTVTYTARRGFRGTDTFTYTVKDDQGALSNLATVRVNVVR